MKKKKKLTRVIWRLQMHLPQSSLEKSKNHSEVLQSEVQPPHVLNVGLFFRFNKTQGSPTRTICVPQLLR